MSSISLKCGASTAVIQRKGAQMISFKGNDGREVLWQGDPVVWEDISPVLFPVCGTPKDGQVIVDNVSYPMPAHGFACRSEFSVARYGEDFVDLVLVSNNETKVHYPFDFAFHVVYTLRENGFRADYIVENKSTRIMPFCVGAHPGIQVPMELNQSFNDYRLVFPYQEQGRNLLVTEDGLLDGEEIIPLENGKTLILDHVYFDKKDSLVFANMRSRSVDLVSRSSGNGIRVSYPKMEALVIWSMPNTNSDFVCIEPWHGLPGFVSESGRFEDKAFVTMLQPGMSHQCGYDVELI